MSSSDELEKQVTPEQLARALPGGLAMYDTEGEFVYGPHHAYIEDKLMELYDKPLRLAISQPPQTGKTFLSSIYFVAWYAMKFPNKTWIIISNSEDFATGQIGRPIREIIQRSGPKVFGVDLEKDATSKKNFILTNKSEIFATGITGSFVGRKASGGLVLDDLLRDHTEATKSYLDEIWTRFTADVYSRLHKNAHVVISNTRWAEDDLIGRLIENSKRGGDQYEEIRFPALAEENDILGREPGEALWPEQFDKEHYERIKAQISPYWWQSMYQQNPQPAEGYIVDINKFKRYTEVPSKKPEWRIISWDTAYKEKEYNDPSVAEVWDIFDGKIYLRDVIRERIGFTKLQEYARMLHDSWHPNIHVVEDRGSGTSLIQWMQEEGIPVHDMQTGNESKVIRMDSEAPQINAGLVYIPSEDSETAPEWVKDFLSEVAGFPNATTHDDRVDAMSQALKFIRERNARQPLQIF